MMPARLEPEMRFWKQGDGYKILIMTALLVTCCALTYYFHAILEMGMVFTHFFYVPIILAAVWWRRKGLVVAVFLAVLLIISHLFIRGEAATANDYLRAIMFIAIAFVVATLRETIAKAQAKTAHLNAVMRAIRNVNQLIANEDDRDRMIGRACEHLIETRGYHSAWIALVDEDRSFVTAAEAGLGARFAPVVEMMKRGEFTRCGEKVLEQSEVVVVEDVASDCGDCPLVSAYSGSAGMSVRLKSGDRVYGMLAVAIPAEMAFDAEEQSLLSDVADDIAFGLYHIEQEAGRRQAEETLKESESGFRRLHSMLRLMCDTLPELIWTKDMDGKFMFANKACCDDLLNAGDTNEPVGKTDMYFADREKQSHPENPNYHTFGKTCTSSDEAVLKSQKAIRTEESGNIKGRFVVLDVLKAPFWDEEGKLIGTVGSAKDVTRAKEVEKERKRAEEKLRESEGRYQRMVANVPGMVYQFVLHPDGSMAFPFVSESCSELFGMAPHEIMRDANVLLDLIQPDIRVAFYRSVADSAKSLSPWGWEGQCIVSGEERWFRCSSRPEQQANGDILWDGLITDITERKLAETRINAEYHRAEFYIDLMSHDINNLSQVASGHLELLLRMPDHLPSKFRKHAETALDHVMKSAEIISNVKTISTVRSGELGIEKIDIYPAFASAVETAKSQPRDVRINSNITEGRYFICGNALLFDVFSNLLNNAIKFDGHDIVEIDVDISSSGDDWAIEFKDRGHGIGYDYKKIIFNRMEMAGESTQGSGLGLTIVKYIVESYGGNIWVEDRVRGDLTQGSNFIVLLPRGEGTNHGKNIHRG